MRKFRKLKRGCLILLCVAMLFGAGCSKQGSDEKGYIYRNDLEAGDLAFLFEELEYVPGETTGQDIYAGFKAYTIKPDDIIAALGLPATTSGSSRVIRYRYWIGDSFDIVIIEYFIKKDFIIFDPSLRSFYDNEELLIEIWATGERTIDRDKYKMRKRFDISEEELSFIRNETNSEEIQNKFGAPHYYYEAFDEEAKDELSNIFVYELENGNVFLVTYYGQGLIGRAWVEDEEGNEIKQYAEWDGTIP